MKIWAILLIITAFAGFIGGYINFMNEKIDPNEPRKKIYIFFKWFLYGFGAAAAVPAFLGLTQSEWLEEIFNHKSIVHISIYSGLCVVVAIFPVNFLTSMINRINAIENENQKLKNEIIQLKTGK